MTVVDTSVWIGHLRTRDTRLSQLLADQLVAVHRFVIGELARGTLRNRLEMVRYLRRLPEAPVALDAEVHHLLESHRLWGLGLGWVGLHLLASAMLSGFNLFTTDRTLMRAAMRLGIAYPAP